MMELSMLCGVRMQLILEDVKFKKFIYYKSDSKASFMVPDPKIRPLIKEVYSNEDVSQIKKAFLKKHSLSLCYSTILWI